MKTSIALALLLLRPLTAAPVEARSADGFVDTIGVNTHIHYTNRIYNDFPKLKAALVNLQVRHLRDGLVDSKWTPYIERVNDLAAAGMKFTMIVSMPIDRVIPVAEKVRNAIGSFEGPNEVDLNRWSVEKTRDYQRDLWTALKASSFANTPVLSASVTKLKYAQELGDISAWCDYSNIHPYPGGSEPETGPGVGTDLGAGLTIARAMAGEKPIQITETGYHNATENGGGHVAVSEKAAGIYLPRLFLYNFNNGITRSYWYELLNGHLSDSDKEANFGLYRNDGTTIKPAGRAMKNLIALLADPGPSFPVGKLDFTLSDPQAQSVLLQKRNGEFWLALWLKSSLADDHRPYGQKQEVDPKDRECKIQLTGVQKTVKLHEKLDAETPVTREIANPEAFTITLSERVVFLQIAATKTP